MTTETYDALGRLTAVWTPGHTQASGAGRRHLQPTPSATPRPSVVTTQHARPGHRQLPGLRDPLRLARPAAARPRTRPPDGGRDITDIVLRLATAWTDLDLRTRTTTTGAPSATLVGAPDDQVPSQTGYVYDGDGRVIQADLLQRWPTETWETDTAYGGDYATTVSYHRPVRGGTPQTTFTDGRGLTSDDLPVPRRGHPADPSDPAVATTTRPPTPTPRPRQLATITDAAGNSGPTPTTWPATRSPRPTPTPAPPPAPTTPAGQLLTRDRRPRQDHLLHLRRRRPQDRRVRHHRRRRGDPAPTRSPRGPTTRSKRAC